MSEAIRTHIPCPLCGSHDAGAEYSDGHFYCFSCCGYIQGDREIGEKSMSKELFSDIEFKPWNSRKLTLETCQKYGYGIASDGSSTWQVAPYYNKDGELVGQHLRILPADFVESVLLFGNLDTLHKFFLGAILILKRELKVNRVVE